MDAYVLPKIELLGPSFSLVIAFVLKSIATPAFLKKMFIFMKCIFHHSTFTLCVFLSEVTYRQTACISVLFSYPFSPLICFYWNI